MGNNIKVLIYGQPFNNFSGGGITLSNLFSGWPRDKIAVLSIPFMLQTASYDICDNYYQIGRDEYHWKFPFSLYKQTYPSGKILHATTKKGPDVKKDAAGIMQYISAKVINPFIHWLGLSNYISHITISPKLEEWLMEFKPDILYIQISDHEGILFAQDLIEYLKIPSVIHMMDDWPSTISIRGPLRYYWNKKIDKEFKRLLDKIDLHLSISDAMSEEYLKRYGKHFVPFHNPVDIDKFDILRKEPERTSSFKILYIGRVGTANSNSIVYFAKVISRLKIDRIKIEFDIFTNEFGITEIKPISNIDNVKIRPSVAYEMVPVLLKEYDLLLLPLDFTTIGLKFAKLSIPTKASEFMLSGTPVLVYAPADTAVSKFFSTNECGYCVTAPDKEKIGEAIKTLALDKEYRMKISRNALNLAKERFDSEKVRFKFQNLLANAIRN